MSKIPISVSIDEKLNKDVFNLYTKLQSETMKQNGKMTKISFSKVLNAVLIYGLGKLLDDGDGKIWEYLERV